MKKQLIYINPQTQVLFEKEVDLVPKYNNGNTINLEGQTYTVLDTIDNNPQHIVVVE